MKVLSGAGIDWCRSWERRRQYVVPTLDDAVAAMLAEPRATWEPAPDRGAPTINRTGP
jgi:hypothetical protein